MKKASQYIWAFAAVASLVISSSLQAQVGNDNPTGVTGQFNGNSQIGCSVSPYTANATRSVVDLNVAGATAPMLLTRTYNSRGANQANHLGSDGWTHSFLWSASTDETVNTTPAGYTVSYPDGRTITFTPSTKSDTVYNGPAGTSERFQQVSGSGEVYLLLPDGNKIQFHQNMTRVGPGEVFFTLKPVQAIDSHGLITTYTLDVNNCITQVTEPAGRWFKFTYDGPNGKITKVDAGYGANTITKSVTYTYGTCLSGGNNYTVLTGASYSDGTSATYTYQASNLATGWPLVRTCDDVRYPGPMKRIGYSYTTGTGAVYGQISSENYYAGGIPAASPTPVPTPVVSLTVSGSTRTEARGDGAHPTRTWNYGSTTQSGFSVPKAYLLGDVTDFMGTGTHSYFSYDTNSYLNKIKDGNGNITSFTRLALTGNISVVTHPGDASTVQYSYTDSTTGYFLDHVIDELNHTAVQYTRDTNHRVTRIDYPDGGYETYTYNGFSEVLTHRITDGGTYQYGYDARGLLKTLTDPYLNVANYTYDANDHLQTVKDPRNNTSTLTFDTLGRLTTVQHPAPNSSTIIYSYNADSTLYQVTDELNHITTYNYDDYKRLTSIATPLRGNGDTNGTPTTYFWYDVNGTGVADYTHTDSRVTRLVLPSGKVSKTVYDANFRKSSATAGFGTADAATTSFAYDLVGNLFTVTEPNGQTGGINQGAHWTYNYDVRNRLTAVDDPVGDINPTTNHTIQWTYDVANNVLTTTRANNQVITNNTFDSMNRVLQQTVQQSPSPDAVSKYTYYASGRLHTFQDPKLVADLSADSYTYVCDQMGRLQSTQYPLDTLGVHRTESLTYDAASNVGTYTNRAGNILTFTYDERNQLTLRHWNDGVMPDVTIGYDTASRMTSVNNSNANVTRAYYNDNLPYTETIAAFPSPSPAPAARTVSYTYDADSNRSTIAYPGPSPVPVFTYGYTNRNQLDNIHDGASAQWVKYVYDPNGNRQHRKLDSAVTDTVYGAADALNRISSISTAFTSGGTATFNYAFDIVSRLKYEQRNGGTADGYTYDFADQITAFNRDGTLSGGSVTGGVGVMSLIFDANGNRTQTTDNGTVKNYVIDALNQYTTDLNGNATFDIKGNLATTAPVDGWSYTYDAQNRLKNADNNSANTHVVYYYDGLNRQVARDENGVRTYNVWDGWNLIQEYNGSGTLLSNYLQGAAVDEMIARFGTNNANRIWYSQDGRGNTSHIANDSGALVESYKYDLGGKPLFFNGSGGSIGASAYSNRFLYNGRDYSSLTNLYDFRSRFYKVDTSRFLQPDPIGFAGGSNLYRFVGNSQANAMDPTGCASANFTAVKQRNAMDSFMPVYGIAGSSGTGAVYGGGIYPGGGFMPGAIFSVGGAGTGSGGGIVGGSGGGAGGGVGTGAGPGGPGVGGIGPNPFVGNGPFGYNVPSSMVGGPVPGALTLAQLLAPAPPLPTWFKLTTNVTLTLAVPVLGRAFIAGAELLGAASDSAEIATAYAVEVQSASAQAQAALAEARAGATLYRSGELGESMAGESQYWSLQNPLSKSFANNMGMPAVSPNFIMGGTLNPGAMAITNEAAALGMNAGSGIQIVTTPGAVGGLWFFMP